MKKNRIDLDASWLASLSLVGVTCALGACSGTPPPPNPEPEARVAARAAAEDEDGSVEPLDKLPMLDGPDRGQVLAEPLARPTALGETTALHMRLPAPQNDKLAGSLVRVIGPSDALQLVFRSDALAKLGVIPRSPGDDYYTAFTTLSRDDLEAARRDQDEVASGAFGETTGETVVFAGRSAIGLTSNPAIEPARFQIGQPPIAVNGCPAQPVSTWAAWDKALFIRDPAVVQDPARTWDPCTGNGTPGGDWTFAHLVREMANAPSQTADQLVTDWLSRWLNPYVVNGDIVPARPEMFYQVIQPWAVASGQSATLSVNGSTGRNELVLSGPLDLNIAPFILDAIVNRIDLGKTSTGTGYSGGGVPTTPGELRFIFTVVQPNPWGAGSEATCGRKPFTVIFEYGVPGDTCPQVKAWAQQWTGLLQLTPPGFTPAYLAQLDSMTEGVVKHGMAPTKGNQNAINQIRTNEIALASQACGGPASARWELREFTLTKETPTANLDVVANGLLQPHSVALTPDDATFSAGGTDSTVNAFLATQVVPSSSTTTLCNTVSNYKVPYYFSGSPFRGGNSQMSPSFWKTGNAQSPFQMCARHQFSLNTCDGCHRGETATNGLSGNTAFTHIDPLSPAPAPLSKFLTGGAPNSFYNVADPQYGAPTFWHYADLHRRLQRLIELANCNVCATSFTQRTAMIGQIQGLGPVPIDVSPGESVPFEVGPITRLDVVGKLLDLRASFANPPSSMPIDFGRAPDAFSH
jgi:hypothetical protein